MESAPLKAIWRVTDVHARRRVQIQARGSRSACWKFYLTHGSLIEYGDHSCLRLLLLLLLLWLLLLLSLWLLLLWLLLLWLLWL